MLNPVFSFCVYLVEMIISYDCDSFGFSSRSAWSNLDDDRNCDWQIVSISTVTT